MCWSSDSLSTIQCLGVCLGLVGAAWWATQHFKKTNNAFCDGAVIKIKIIILCVCLFDVGRKSLYYRNYVYTHGAQFSDISGVAKLFYINIHMPACRILHFNIFKRHGALTHVFLPYCVIVSCSELISHFAFLLHVDEDASFTRKQHVLNFVSISLITHIDTIRTSLTALVSHVWDHLLWNWK